MSRCNADEAGKNGRPARPEVGPRAGGRGAAGSQTALAVRRLASGGSPTPTARRTAKTSEPAVGTLSVP